MRKADYHLLARLIRQNLTPENRDSLTFLAREFAKAASVNQSEFLKACGIE